MKTQMGEYVIGAYLSQILGCDFVDYNVRPASSGLEGLAEFDVIGFNFVKNISYMCEVTTHLGGVQYGNNKDTLKKIEDKIERQKRYASEYLKSFDKVLFMFWAPYVAVGFLSEGLSKISGLDLVINADYTSAVRELQKLAKDTQKDIGNPFFRSLQIVAHLRQ